MSIIYAKCAWINSKISRGPVFEFIFKRGYFIDTEKMGQ